MLKAEAEREVIRRWRALPKHQRSTGEQATAFATSLMEDIFFPTSGDRYHFIRGWLQHELVLRSTV